MRSGGLRFSFWLWLSGGALACDQVATNVQTEVMGLNSLVWRTNALRDDGVDAVRQGRNRLPIEVWARDSLLSDAEVDAVILPGGLDQEGGAFRVSPEIMEVLARAGKKVLVDQREGGVDLAPEESPVRTVRLNSAYLKMLQADGDGGANVSLSSTIDIDTVRGTYQLRELGLGFLDDRLWFVRELPEEDDLEDSGSVGLQFRKEW